MYTWHYDLSDRIQSSDFTESQNFWEFLSMTESYYTILLVNAILRVKT